MIWYESCKTDEVKTMLGMVPKLRQTNELEKEIEI